MSVNLGDWLFNERGDPVVGAAVSVARTDGTSFTFNSTTATSHSTTTSSTGYWEFLSLPDPGAGVYYDVTITSGQQVRQRKGGIMVHLREANLAQDITLGASQSWDLSAGTVTLPTGGVTADMIENRTRSLFLPAGAFLSTIGSPDTDVIDEAVSAWNLDASTREGVTTTFVMPHDWDSGTVSIYVYYYNLTDESGATWRCNVRLGQYADAGQINTANADGSSFATAGVTGGRMLIEQHAKSFTPSGAGTTLIGVSVIRDATHADDDYTDDIAFVGLRLDYTADS